MALRERDQGEVHHFCGREQDFCQFHVAFVSLFRFKIFTVAFYIKRRSSLNNEDPFKSSFEGLNIDHSLILIENLLVVPGSFSLTQYTVIKNQESLNSTNRVSSLFVRKQQATDYSSAAP